MFQGDRKLRGTEERSASKLSPGSGLGAVILIGLVLVRKGEKTKGTAAFVP